MTELSSIKKMIPWGGANGQRDASPSPGSGPNLQSRLQKMLDGLKYENKNLKQNIDFGTATPTEMFAEQKEPKTFKEKRKAVALKPNILDQERALIQEENILEN